MITYKEQYKQLKKYLRLTDIDIAAWFGFASVFSFRGTTKKPSYEEGFVKVAEAAINRVKEDYQPFKIYRATIKDNAFGTFLSFGLTEEEALANIGRDPEDLASGRIVLERYDKILVEPTRDGIVNLLNEHII